MTPLFFRDLFILQPFIRMPIYFRLLVLLIFVILNSQQLVTLANWNFTEVGLLPDILIWRFTIWRSKAYLAVPRWDKKLKVPFTLLEVPWPETGYPLQFGIPILTGTIPFPNAKYQLEGNCRNLQSVTGLDSDTRGRLWVLDAPSLSYRCPPKIVLFDIRRGEKVTETDLRGVSPRNLRCLVTDPDLSQLGGQAYVSDPGDESIIVYSLARKNWWRLKLSRESGMPRIFSTDLAVSRKSSLMYLTGYQSDDLWTVDLEVVRNPEESPSSFRKNNSDASRIPASWVGSKLGLSSGLVCDYREGLHYFMVTEMASVRWDVKYKLEAESHAVLYQSETVPAVTDFALDSQRNVWALVNARHPFLAKTKRNDKLPKKNGESIERRTIRIYKFNPFVLDLSL